MKLFLVAIVASLFLPVAGTKYIKSTLLNENFITINFSDSLSLKCDIKKENSKRYFLLRDNKKVYLDVDKTVQWIENIDSLFKVNTLRPDLVLGEPLPIMYLVFIFDEDGGIIYQGFDREFPQNNYHKEFFRLMTLVKGKVEPATVNGKKVSSILKLNINYYKLFED